MSTGVGAAAGETSDWKPRSILSAHPRIPRAPGQRETNDDFPLPLPFEKKRDGKRSSGRKKQQTTQGQLLETLARKLEPEGGVQGGRRAVIKIIINKQARPVATRAEETLGPGVIGTPW